ncbi:uncharacterized protein LOC112172760 [Rosa chinensis]|uniref:uncharacterized protein LOC112172760 n=1 Tax=Rosa chinensis TaxID=74649 RepID=UPI001AD8A165|nr:uncharacterized protein LOC112172760 [Rosa chinensis]
MPRNASIASWCLTAFASVFEIDVVLDFDGCDWALFHCFGNGFLHLLLRSTSEPTQTRLQNSSVEWNRGFKISTGYKWLPSNSTAFAIIPVSCSYSVGLSLKGTSLQKWAARSQETRWKAVGNDMQRNPGYKPEIKKRLPKKIRQIPECYFLPRRSRLYNLTFVGACIAGGIGAGMLVEMWINMKFREDGGVLWEFDK